eukprot:CAMPEP_0171518660 /NCGR_PEP_ID=MMETSP0959-20130129/5410_1 /TAXON_ID=87120 /ORGANISM="Aurantiochytrium limacinum, Strain ATCCMYA-1381" /LENGTH=64 /DNA_ID=CAMNT_0012057895 /DNA_START=411 /DNA_END=605 /DNA_ORIENTATION=+
MQVSIKIEIEEKLPYLNPPILQVCGDARVMSILEEDAHGPSVCFSPEVLHDIFVFAMLQSLDIV